MMLRTAGRAFIAAAFLAWALGPASAGEPGAAAGGPTLLAQTTGGPTPSPSPSAAVPPAPSAVPPRVTPSPSASPKARRFSLSMSSSTSFVNQQFTGPGIVPPQAALFAAGSPIAPGTPYDFWTSSPNVVGYGINEAFLVTPSYKLSDLYDVAVTLGYGSLSGSANVAGYWGDQPLATINPHLGMRTVTLPVAFPTYNKGGDTISGTRGSVLSGTFARHDGSFALRAGWFDPAQGESFVFNQPPQTNTPIAFTEPLPEGLGNGPQTFDIFKNVQTRLPLQGLDLTFKAFRDASVELLDAQLPSPPGTSARVASGSLEISRGTGLSYGAEIARVVTAGAPIGTSILFGGNGQIVNDPQFGPLPVSTLGGQTMLIGGLRATFPLNLDTDAQLRIGMSCYGATGTAISQSGCTTGRYYYGRLHHGFRSFDLAIEAMREDATYAPAILPYGVVPENVWSAPYTWPGTWLKGAYQFIDNSQIGPNRQGLRATANTLIAGIELRAAYAIYNQIRPYDTSTAFTPGFVEGYFLPQLGGVPGTLGRETHASLSLIAHPKIFDVEIDLSDVTLHRSASTNDSREAVSMNYPSGTITLSRQLHPKWIGSLGAGRYAVDGAFSTSGPKNADLWQRVVFAGLQLQSNPTSGYAIQYRLYSVNGLPTNFGLAVPGPGPLAPVSPAYHGPQIIVEQRFRT